MTLYKLINNKAQNNKPVYINTYIWCDEMPKYLSGLNYFFTYQCGYLDDVVELSPVLVAAIIKETFNCEIIKQEDISIYNGYRKKTGDVFKKNMFCTHMSMRVLNEDEHKLLCKRVEIFKDNKILQEVSKIGCEPEDDVRKSKCDELIKRIEFEMRI